MTYFSVFQDKTSPLSLIPEYYEIFRYMGYSFKDRNLPEDEVRPVVYEVAADFQKLIEPQSVYACYPLEIENQTLKFADVQIESKDLSRNLKGCKAVYLFAATIGPLIDKEIQKMQRLNPVKSVVMQATGAMYIERYCDYLCDFFKTEAKKEMLLTKNRFSPGYGDVRLDQQKNFFRLLDCKKIGLTLMDTLIMAPEKSVTAFVGVYDENSEKKCD